MNQTCNRCVLDTSDPQITFDAQGECCYCQMFDDMLRLQLRNLPHLDELMLQLKRDGKNKAYDAILGVSGGLDSSYVAYLAKLHDLRVLLVHANNGFDDSLATQNIACIVKHTGFPLVNYVLNPNTFRNLTVAFLDASLVDADVPADHAIVALVWKTAIEQGTPYILSGGNQATEFYMPRTWTYANKSDLVHMKSVYRHNGNSQPLNGFPMMGVFKKLYWRWKHHITYVFPLNYICYNIRATIRLLQHEWDWQPYGHKHGENIYTRFYQNYLLPNKFGVDKRKAHFSALIRSGQLTREEALKELEKHPYDPTDFYGVPTGSPTQFQTDKAFVLTMLGLSEEQFDRIMRLPPHVHAEFGSDQWVYDMLRFIKRIRVKMGLRTRLRGLMKR